MDIGPSNTFVRVLNDSRERPVVAEIGDTKQAAFYPQLKLPVWDNECNFSIRLVDADPTNGVVLNEKDVVVWFRAGRTCRFYQKPGSGFEFEVELAAAPAKNWLDFTLQHKGLRFLYQPALTAEEIAESAERPENVVGSYAVYHATRRGNLTGGKAYGTGKAFHIYRPSIKDAADVTAWCDLELDTENNTARITIPQAFLDAATYPVIVDPDFGYTSVGASTTGGNANELKGVPLTAPASGTLDSVSAWCAINSAGNHVKCLLALASTGAILTNGIGAAVSIPTGTPPASAAASTMASPPAITGSTAYIAALVLEGFTSRLYYDAGSAGDSYAETNDYASPATLGTTPGNDKVWSIFFTYTASGGASTGDFFLMFP